MMRAALAVGLLVVFPYAFGVVATLTKAGRVLWWIRIAERGANVPRSPRRVRPPA
jgi:hypothetical protein